MHNLWRRIPIAAAAVALVMSQSTQSTEAQMGHSRGAYFYCSSDPDQPVVYFTHFFVADPGTSVRTVENDQRPGYDPVPKMQNDFLTFLKHKYSLKSNSNYPTGCPSFGPDAAGLSLAQASKKSLESQYKQAGKKIVETDWKYKP